MLCPSLYGEVICIYLILPQIHPAKNAHLLRLTFFWKLLLSHKKEELQEPMSLAGGPKICTDQEWWWWQWYVNLPTLSYHMSDHPTIVCPPISA